jgi:curli production assembly/transport component CsgF
MTAGATSALPGVAQDLVYTPINPSFGGNPFNSSHLLGIANAQNGFTDERAQRRDTTRSQSDLFVRQLQSRLLSSLAGQVNDAIFGEDAQDSGRIAFGDQVIEFERGLDAVRLTITDQADGAVTEIEIPTFFAE